MISHSLFFNCWSKFGVVGSVKPVNYVVYKKISTNVQFREIHRPLQYHIDESTF